MISVLCQLREVMMCVLGVMLVLCMSLCVSSIVVYMYFFFFQAEDGIRDLVRSRGLGDVYKRQSSTWKLGSPTLIRFLTWRWPACAPLPPGRRAIRPVSSTHLTLPTIYSV